MTADPTYFMQHALSLARRNLGQTWPNPAVGAVVVKDGEIVGEGYTARGGRPHAETQALAKAGEKAKGATIYVSLEPCAHHGKTPPCTDAIIKAGITTCYAACRDPNKPVNGKGIEQLKAAGINVIEGLCEAEARQLNRGFISVIERRRPYVAMKIATSSDGKIAGGKSKWITGEAARNEVHRLRSEFDAIITGIGTVLTDDPLLTVRIAGLEHKSPVRVILDRNHRLPRGSKLAQSTDASPVLVMNTQSIPEVLTQLADKGFTRVLVEAGQRINTAFLASGLVDQIYWFKAPVAIGEAGLDVAKGGLSALASWRAVKHTAFPPDTLEILEPCSQA